MVVMVTILSVLGVDQKNTLNEKFGTLGKNDEKNEEIEKCWRHVKFYCCRSKVLNSPKKSSLNKLKVVVLPKVHADCFFLLIIYQCFCRRDNWNSLQCKQWITYKYNILSTYLHSKQNNRTNSPIVTVLTRLQLPYKFTNSNRTNSQKNPYILTDSNLLTRQQ